MSWIGPGIGPDTHRIVPFGEAMTCRFIPCALCLPEWNGRSARPRSIAIKVPSSTTYRCPSFFAFRNAWASFGDLADSRRTVSST
jgi:hypothetical protein